MKKILLFVLVGFLISGVYAQIETPQPQASSKEYCDKADELVKSILKEIRHFNKLPLLKNPAIENHLLKSQNYMWDCKLDKALHSVNSLITILSQKKYDKYIGVKKLCMTYEKYIILCCEKRCKILK